MGSFPLKCFTLVCVCSCIGACVYLCVHGGQRLPSGLLMKCSSSSFSETESVRETGFHQSVRPAAKKTQGISTWRDQGSVTFPVLREQTPATTRSFCYMDAGARNSGVCACKAKQSKASALLSSCEGLSKYPCCGWLCATRASENCSTSHTGTGAVTHVFTESPQGLISTCHRVNTW